MSKAITGAAMLAGAVAIGAAEFAMASTGVGIALLPMMTDAMMAVGAAGVAMEAGAIASALTDNRGIDITTRQPASPRQIIYGTQRVGGVLAYQSTTGSHNDQFNFVLLLAGHKCFGIQALYLDGRKVWFSGDTATPINPNPGWSVQPNGVGFGGAANGTTYTGPDGNQYLFYDLVFANAYLGTQTAADLDGYLTANDPNWNTSSSGTPYLGGCTWMYVKCEYYPSVFPAAPEIRVTVDGMVPFDPRTNAPATIDTFANSALVIADWVSNTEYGMGMPVNQEQLIAAANVCDEQVALAAGGTESRYQCHYHFDTSTTPSDALATMLKSCAGRISVIGGEVYIFPAYWQGPSASFDETNLTAPFEWDPTAAYKDNCNFVQGTYTAPNYPYAVAGNLYDSNGFDSEGNLQNNFQFGFQPTSFPPYAQDPLHGYASNQWLNEDSGVSAAWSDITSYAAGAVVGYTTDIAVGTNTVPYYSIYRSLVADNLGNTPGPTSEAWALAAVNLPLDANYNMVLSIAQAQRLAKIDLLRRRFWGRGSMEMGLSAFTLQEIDVMNFTFTPYSWSDTPLEILGCSFSVKAGQGSPANPGAPPECRITFQVGQTDPSIYELADTDELSIYDVPQLTMTPATPAPPTGLTLLSGPSTAVVAADGIVTPQIEVSWDTPLDGLVTQIEVQFSLAAAVTWSSAGYISVDVNSALVGPIVAGQTYIVQIRSVRANGATSAWVSGTVTAALVTSILGTASLPATVVQGSTGTNVNLVPDSNLQFGMGSESYWTNPDANWSVVSSPATANPAPSSPVPGCNAFAVGSGDSGTYANSVSAEFSLIAGQTYTLSGYIDAYGSSGDFPYWGILDPSITTQYVAISAPSSLTGRSSATFTFSPAGIAAGTSVAVVLIFDIGNCAIPSGAKVFGAAPMVQLGTEMTAYVAGVGAINSIDGFAHAAMSSAVQSAVSPDGIVNYSALAAVVQSAISPEGVVNYSALDAAITGAIGSDGVVNYGALNAAIQAAVSSTGVVANLGGILAASITPIAGLMPAQAAADVTAQNANILLQNPNFVAGATGWGNLGGANGAIIIAEAGGLAYNGSPFALEMAGAGTNESQNWQQVPCSAGDVLSASAFIRYYGPTATGTAVIRWDFYDATGTYVGSPQSNIVSVTETTDWSSWNPVRVVATAPSAGYAVLGAVVFNNSAGNWLFGGFGASLLPSSLDEVPNGATYGKVNLNNVDGGGNVTNSTALGGVAAASITPIVELMPAQAAADVTALNVITSTVQVEGQLTMPATGINAVSGFYLTLNATATTNVWNVWGALMAWNAGATSGAGGVVYLYIDGASVWSNSFVFTAAEVAFPFYSSLSGLSPGTHTLQVYVASDNDGITINLTGYGTFMMVQQVK